MKVAKFSDRLCEAMQDHNWKQSQLLILLQAAGKDRGVTFNKSDLSQYVNGHVTAGPEKMGVLADVLGVSSVWLSGEDTPKDPFESTLYALDFVVVRDGAHVRVSNGSVKDGAWVEYTEKEWARLSAKFDAMTILHDVENADAGETKSPSSEENGPSAEAQEAAMLFDHAPAWLRQQVLGLLRAAESNHEAPGADPKDK